MGQSFEPNLTRVVAIGDGMVGHRLCQRMRELDEIGRVQLAVLGEERSVAYDRMRLTSFLTAAPKGELQLADERWYLERGIGLRLGVRAPRIDRDARVAETSAGELLYEGALGPASAYHAVGAECAR